MAKAIMNGNEIFGNVHLGEGGDVANPNIADIYDPTQTYNTGDRRIYDDVLYVCNDDNVTGAWDSTKWDSATIDEIISALTADDIEYSSGVSVADKLDSLSTYSTTEQAVGTWINGKTIYQKTVSIGALPNNATVGYEVVGEAIEELIDISVIGKSTDGIYYIVLPNLSSIAAFQISFDVEIDNGKTKVFITTARDVTAFSGVVTMRYTKR